MAAVEPPPNSTGNPQRDITALSQWIWALYKNILAGGGLTTTNESSAIETGLQNQIDPASATAQTAQTTANSAEATANANKAILDAQDAGKFTISDSAVSIDVNLTNTQADTNYYVAASVSAISGAPAVNAHIISHLVKTNTKFTAHIKAAPGASTSVTYDWVLMRKD